MLKFYYNTAPNPMKVALFLEESGLPYEAVPVDTRKGEQFAPDYVAINPNSKAPTILDDGKPIGLKRGGASISLEPAGQLELSGGLQADLHATHLELEAHLREVHQVAGPMGVGFAALGFHPTHTRAEMPWMPKGRYAIMRRYMPTVGSLGLDMMQRTCTVAVRSIMSRPIEPTSGM